jgi:hypothetical protein
MGVLELVNTEGSLNHVDLAGSETLNASLANFGPERDGS